jgi:hypothetical protein
MTLICPERPGAMEKWVTVSGGVVSPLAAASVQREVTCFIEVEFPQWQHGREWNSCAAFLLRNSTNAEELGLIDPPPPPTYDDICNSVALDPAVKAAATPRDLVYARLQAQRRVGIEPERQAPLYSGEVDSILLPVIGTILSRSHVREKLAELRRGLRATYGDAAEAILEFSLRTCVHRSRALDDLRADARETTPAA